MSMLILILILATGIPQRASALEQLERGKQLYWTHCTDSVERSFEGVQQAVKELEQAVELDPSLADAHLYLGRAYYCLAVDYNRLYSHKEGSEEFKTKARQHARQAVGLAPNNAEAHYWLAFVLDYKEHRDEIISELKRAMELNPNYAEALWDLGILLAAEDQTLEEGVELMKRAIAKIDNPDLTRSKRGRLADLLMEKGRYREALQWYETLLPSHDIEKIIIPDLKKKIEQQKQKNN